MVSLSARVATDAHAEAQTAVASIDMIGARIDRLPATRAVWKMVILLSLGGFFEFYELFSTAYIAPGIIKSGILSATTATLFGLNGLAGFIAANFAGLFVGTCLFGFVADKCGRRAIFTFALLWYSIAAAAMAFQNDAAGLLFWRFMVGIGLGIEMVTIDAYLSELVPKHMRGRAFALNQLIQFLAVPTVALLAWLLVPAQPFGIDGWRWVALIGALGALPIWAIRKGLPESPRWLAARGKLEQAQAIVARLEKQVVIESGRVLPPATPEPRKPEQQGAGFKELWSRKYAPRTIMLVLFHIFQSIGLYGFVHWAPTFLVKQGITLTASLGYTLAIAFVTPLGPSLAMFFADRVERKWQIVLSALLVAIGGLVFGHTRDPFLIVSSGIVETLAASILAYNFHAYQAELYPTRIRAMAVGFVYSWSRLSGAASGFLIAFALARYGVSGAFVLIAACMGMVMLAIGIMGPKTKGLALETI